MAHEKDFVLSFQKMYSLWDLKDASPICEILLPLFFPILSYALMKSHQKSNILLLETFL